MPQGGPDIGLKVGILAEIGNMLHECAMFSHKSIFYCPPLCLIWAFFLEKVALGTKLVEEKGAIR